MKKLTAIIIALLMVAATALTACNGADKPVEENNVPVDVTESTEFNTTLEEKLAEIVPTKDIDKEMLLNVGGVPMSAAAVRYATIACNSFYADSTEENVEELKADEIDNFYRLNAAVVNMADEMDINLSDEEFQSSITDNYNAMKESYGDDFETVVETYTYQTPYFYFLNQYYNLLYSKLYEQYSTEEEFAANLKAETLKDMLESETPYVRAKHILVCFPEEGEGEDGAITDAQKEETLKKANDVLALVESGEDFDALIAEYGEDPGAQTYPGGYYFTTGMMVAPFEEAAFALEEGQTSGLVETNYGYHIIKRLPLDDDAIVATEEYAAKGYELFIEKLGEIADEYEIFYADNYEERCAEFEAEFQAMMAPVEEEAPEEEHNHDHEAEAEEEAAEEEAE